MKIQRYAWNVDVNKLIKHSHGGWVKWSDVEELLASKSPNNRYATALEVWEYWHKQAPPENIYAADFKGWLQRSLKIERLTGKPGSHS